MGYVTVGEFIGWLFVCLFAWIAIALGLTCVIVDQIKKSREKLDDLIKSLESDEVTEVGRLGFGGNSDEDEQDDAEEAGEE